MPRNYGPELAGVIPVRARTLVDERGHFHTNAAFFVWVRNAPLREDPREFAIDGDADVAGCFHYGSGGYRGHFFEDDRARERAPANKSAHNAAERGS